MTESYKPTEDESTKIDRAMIRAAWESLQALNGDFEMSKGVLACLDAFKRADKARRTICKSLLQDNPGHDYVEYYGDVSACVCSALAFIDRLPEELSPLSLGGARISAMLKASRVMEAMADVHTALDNDEGVFGEYLASDAKSYLEQFVDR